jgi:hypothetical protein
MRKRLLALVRECSLPAPADLLNLSPRIPLVRAFSCNG